MTDLTHILGGPWKPPAPAPVAAPEDQLRSAMLGAGIEPPDRILMDGKLHRFNSRTNGKGGHDKPGWYVVFPDKIPAGKFGCWRAGIEANWQAEMGRDLSAAERMVLTNRMREAQLLRDAERARSAEVAAETCETIWESASAASPDHPYLRRKGIAPHGSRVTGDGRLIVPLFSADGELASLQYISADGEKRYHPGGSVAGKFWSIGSDTEGVVYLAEGFATAATIHETTGKAVFVAYSAHNLVPVTQYLRERFPSVVIVADNDESGVGQSAAEQAAAKYGARVVVPPLRGDANDYAQAGHDLASLLAAPAADWLIQADAFCQAPAPIRWLIKGWLQEEALIMVHGPSGGGKTFVVLDMCLRLASGGGEWMGNRAKGASVVYLAGEGHHGLRGRIAAWKSVNAPASALNMWLSRDGCDLNQPAGLQRVCDNLRALPAPPALVVVDTLHRFLAGDENSAQDTKTMLDACAQIMREFSCSVLLVHHTGVSDEAQHRARGSSAWRGALEIEISVIPPKGDAPLQIVQRKSKDAELADPLYAELQSTPVPGWIDEDGEAVTSAVLIPSAPPTQTRGESKLERHRKLFEQAWWAAGAEEREGAPYLSASAFRDFLTSKMGLSEATAAQYTKAKAAGKPISELLLAEVVEIYEHGWRVTESVTASSMMIRKNSK